MLDFGCSVEPMAHLDLVTGRTLQRQLKKPKSGHKSGQKSGIKQVTALISELFRDKNYRNDSFFCSESFENHRARRLLKVGCPKCRG